MIQESRSRIPPIAAGNLNFGVKRGQQQCFSRHGVAASGYPDVHFAWIFTEMHRGATVTRRRRRYQFDILRPVRQSEIEYSG